MRYSLARLLAIILTTAVIGLAANIPGQSPGQSKLVSSVKKTIGPEGATYVFKLYSIEALSNYHYRIEVCDESGRIILQSEEIRNGVRLEDSPGSFKIVDVDSDKYDDIKMLGGYREGKAWYKIWLYDAQKQKYMWDSRSHGR